MQTGKGGHTYEYILVLGIRSSIRSRLDQLGPLIVDLSFGDVAVYLYHVRGTSVLG